MTVRTKCLAAAAVPGCGLPTCRNEKGSLKEHHRMRYGGAG
ncbi:hypothetical protein [Acetobacter cibinongensis]|nr:hypothetical protein [Acetobacter cibinongensis]